MTILFQDLLTFRNSTFIRNFKVCKTTKKDGRLFATHYFTKSTLPANVASLQCVNCNDFRVLPFWMQILRIILDPRLTFTNANNSNEWHEAIKTSKISSSLVECFNSLPLALKNFNWDLRKVLALREET